MIQYKGINLGLKLNEMIDEYEQKTSGMPSYKYKCSCKNSKIISYGSYKRQISDGGDVQYIKIKRLYCKNCKKTHALIPAFIVPYERTTILYLLKHGNASLHETINKADFEMIRINRLYKYWDNLLTSNSITISNDIEGIIEKCIKIFGLFFLQFAF